MIAAIMPNGMSLSNVTWNCENPCGDHLMNHMVSCGVMWNLYSPEMACNPI